MVLRVEVEGPLLVIRNGADAEVQRYFNICPHSGGPLARPGVSPVARDGLHLVCQTHGALFRVSDGVCVAGPCQGARLQTYQRC